VSDRVGSIRSLTSAAASVVVALHISTFGRATYQKSSLQRLDSGAFKYFQMQAGSVKSDRSNYYRVQIFDVTPSAGVGLLPSAGRFETNGRFVFRKGRLKRVF
jgi:hypothetical protein